MPSFLITSATLQRYGDTIEATLCDVNGLGHPDRRSDVPVKATISEKTIRIDDEPHARSIISCVGENGVGTYLITGSTQQLRNRLRRTALEHAHAQLQQLNVSLRPLRAQSDEPGLATEGLGLLFNWFNEERERLTEAQIPQIAESEDGVGHGS